MVGVVRDITSGNNQSTPCEQKSNLKEKGLIENVKQQETMEKINPKACHRIGDPNGGVRT